jgi:hypothetical protein
MGRELTGGELPVEYSAVSHLLWEEGIERIIVIINYGY